MKNLPLVFAHIGDLHITKAKEQNYIDFLSIISQIEIECSRKLDFVFLPGDNADNGLPEQYRLVTTALKMLSVPVHIIPGDHDMEQGSLDAFYTMPLTQLLPKSVQIKGYRCLFLDVCGPGKGGPDFRLGNKQLFWLENEIAVAQELQEKIVLFTHTYPADLRDQQEVLAFNQLISDAGVLLVDMGHTHYNELANNGQTIFSATRSTGQIEEGPVGYSIITIDEDIVSWRFKPLADAFPFVMITAPADRRLACGDNQFPAAKPDLHVIVFGYNEIQQVKYKIENGSWTPLFLQAENTDVWSATFEPADRECTIQVEALDASGRPGRYSIQIPDPASKMRSTVKNGSDKDSIGAWPENGIFATQLGPNRNGKPS